MVVETQYDEVVTPYTSAFLSGGKVVNVLLQGTCPADVSEHVGIQYDPAALQWVENALDSGGTANPAFHPGLRLSGEGRPPGACRPKGTSRGALIDLTCGAPDRRRHVGYLGKGFS